MGENITLHVERSWIFFLKTGYCLFSQWHLANISKSKLVMCSKISNCVHIPVHIPLCISLSGLTNYSHIYITYVYKWLFTLTKVSHEETTWLRMTKCTMQECTKVKFGIIIKTNQPLLNQNYHRLWQFEILHRFTVICIRFLLCPFTSSTFSFFDTSILRQEEPIKEKIPITPFK